MNIRVTWVAQSVKCLTLNFGSGRDLVVHEIEPHLELCTDNVEPAWDSLSLTSAPPHSRACTHERALSLSLSKYINKHKKSFLWFKEKRKNEQKLLMI